MPDLQEPLFGGSRRLPLRALRQVGDGLD
jgi:hypothetical protein